MQNAIIGWDIGGAHVKAAALDVEGRVLTVMQLPCPLWQGQEFLHRAVRQVLQQLGNAPRHAITMTGEMVDLFESRADGVLAILDVLAEHFPMPSMQVFAGTRGFVSVNDAADHVQYIASANWQATAISVARIVPEGLLVDMGSTTTDIIALRGGLPAMRGLSDGERLTTDELVYSGVVRTPLMALTPRVSFRGLSVSVMAELFATTADVYRITGELPEGVDQQDAADGGVKTKLASIRRLARMIGLDAGEASIADWKHLAQQFAVIHQHRIFEACQRVLRESAVPEGAPIVAAGAGRFLAHAMAQRLNRSCLDFAVCVGYEGEAWVAECAPAVSVARLALLG